MAQDTEAHAAREEERVAAALERELGRRKGAEAAVKLSNKHNEAERARRRELEALLELQKEKAGVSVGRMEKAMVEQVAALDAQVTDKLKAMEGAWREKLENEKAAAVRPYVTTFCCFIHNTAGS